MSKDKGKKPNKKEEIKQLDLDIKEPFKNKFFKIKGKADFLLLKFEVKKFLKDPLLWATITISLVMILTQLLLLRENYESLPTYLPIFKTYITLTSKLVVKEYLLVYPTISITTLLLGSIAESNYYNREKSLTKIILFAVLAISLSQTIILIDIIKSF